ncbi:Abi family protein [Lacticaseibacillus pabuli]|uniref:Abi family protein n=1 Tax=Lacticaseibacillus pabuli TaxID=3025672 RepID=A0ABY7WWX1_9LACO|nr:Abi family protein [Lacticaseibacillus sp. KACC 23028]WDF83559.1 Abi family protein [Lacticaseibacillus sp. KACC 23028]
MHEKRVFLSIDQQLSLLKQRGLLINDESRARRYLLTNNYYNIVNGYSKYFQSKPDVYIDGADFDEVCHLYFYDKEMKQILMNAILSAENHLKSVLAHRFAEAYPNQRYAYLDVGCYQEKAILSIVYTISKISWVIKRNRKHSGNPINYYVNKYDDVPMWVLVEFLDFGDIQSIISSLPLRIQNRIAKDMTGFLEDNLELNDLRIPPETLVSFIENIRETRNVCAHGNRLIDFNCRASAKYLNSLHDSAGISSDDERNTVYSVLVSLKCFLSRTEYCVLYNSLRKRTRTLQHRLHSVDINSITQHLGFPTDWQEKPLMEQTNQN